MSQALAAENAAPIIDDESAALLAKMDARGVSGAKLQAIFRCSAEELGLCREAEHYKSEFASELLAIEERAATLDDTWDDIEAKALGDMKEQMMLGAVVDPRQLLSIGATANKMSRRAATQSADGLARANAEAAKPVLDASSKVVIRLRTRFVERLDTPAGHAQLLEREATITRTDKGDLIDEITPAELQRHISEGLGINLADMKSGGQSRPDEALDALISSEGVSGGLPSDMFAAGPLSPED